jgi:hypothetical protein
MKLHLVENLHPRFRKLLVEQPVAREIIDRIEGRTVEDWIELRGQLRLLCRLKKPAVEAAIPRIRNTIEGIENKKLRDACSQMAGQYTAIIVRSEIGARNSGTKNRPSELFTRAEVFIDPAEPGKPRKPRGSLRRAVKTHELDGDFFNALESAKPAPEAYGFNEETENEP